MSKTTKDGLTIYDLEPLSSELLVVAGPAGYDVSEIDSENLPAGFRWVDDDEWADLQSEPTQYRFENGKLYKLDGDAYVHCYSSIYATTEDLAIKLYEQSQQ